MIATAATAAMVQRSGKDNSRMNGSEVHTAKPAVVKQQQPCNGARQKEGIVRTPAMPSLAVAGASASTALTVIDDDWKTDSEDTDDDDESLIDALINHVRILCIYSI